MSMCFMELIGRLEEPKISHQSVCFTRNGEFTRRVSDCEELVETVQEAKEDPERKSFFWMNDK